MDAALGKCLLDVVEKTVTARCIRVGLVFPVANQSDQRDILHLATGRKQKGSERPAFVGVHAVVQQIVEVVDLVVHECVGNAGLFQPLRERDDLLFENGVGNDAHRPGPQNLVAATAIRFGVGLIVQMEVEFDIVVRQRFHAVSESVENLFPIFARPEFRNEACERIFPLQGERRCVGIGRITELRNRFLYLVYRFLRHAPALVDHAVDRASRHPGQRCDVEDGDWRFASLFGHRSIFCTNL